MLCQGIKEKLRRATSLRILSTKTRHGDSIRLFVGMAARRSRRSRALRPKGTRTNPRLSWGTIARASIFQVTWRGGC